MLAKAIKAFTKPKVLRVTDMGGNVYPSELTCSDNWCRSFRKLPTTKPVKHRAQCSLMLLKKIGDGPKLMKELARRASELNYDGGGYNSCQICGGQTLWKRLSVKHKKNCPGQLARRLLRGIGE